MKRSEAAGKKAMALGARDELDTNLLHFSLLSLTD